MPASEAPAQTTRLVTIGTGETNGLSHITGVSIARVAEKKFAELGLRLTVKPATGSVFNIDAVGAGDIEFAVVRTDKLYQAIRGYAEWEVRGPQSDLLAVFTIHPISVSLVAADDAGIKTIQDLRGKRVNIGEPGSSQRQSSIHALTNAGINFETDLKAEGAAASEGSAMLQEGRIQAFFYTTEHPNEAIKKAMIGKRKVCFVPIADVNKILLRYPYYVRATIPVRLYPGVTNMEDVPTFGLKLALVTSAKVPTSIVYAIIGEVFDNFESFKEQHATHKTLTKVNMTEGMYRMIHRGALTYYMKNGFRLSCCF